MKMKFEIEDWCNGFVIKKSVSSGSRMMEDESDMERFLGVVGEMVMDEKKLWKDKR